MTLNDAETEGERDGEMVEEGDGVTEELRVGETLARELRDDEGEDEGEFEEDTELLLLLEREEELLGAIETVAFTRLIDARIVEELDCVELVEIDGERDGWDDCDDVREMETDAELEVDFETVCDDDKDREGRVDEDDESELLGDCEREDVEVADRDNNAV